MASRKREEVVSIGTWMWTLLVLAIPCVGFIMSIVWAFSGASESKKNLFRAYWILVAVGFLVYGVAVGIGMTQSSDLRHSFGSQIQRIGREVSK